MKKNKAIYIPLKDYIFLFLSRVPFGCCLKFCWPKYKPFQNLYKKGVHKLEKEMDIVLLIKELRQLKILMQHELKNEDLQLEIKHDQQNLLFIDDDSQT